MADAAGAEPPPEISKVPYFENSYLTDMHSEVGPELLRPFASEFAMLTDLSALLDGNQFIQTDLADYFLQQFGPDGQCTEVGEFLADFDSRYGASQLDFQRDPARLAPRSELRNQLVATSQAFTEHMVDQLLLDAPEVNLDESLLGELLGGLPLAVRQRKVSHSFVGQLFGSAPNRRFVVNQAFSGHSGLLSRFLEVLDEEAGSVCGNTWSGVAQTACTRRFREFWFQRQPPPETDRSRDSAAAVPANWDCTNKLRLQSWLWCSTPIPHRATLQRADGRKIDLFYHGFLIRS